MFDVADIWASAHRRRPSAWCRPTTTSTAGRSAHYDGLAVDLHSSAPDALAEAMRLAGFTVLWKVPGHFGHVHVEVSNQDRVARALGPAVVTPPTRRRAD